MKYVTDRYGRKPLKTEVILDELDRYGRAVTPIKAKAAEPEPVEVVEFEDETENIEL